MVGQILGAKGRTFSGHPAVGLHVPNLAVTARNINRSFPSHAKSDFHEPAEREPSRLNPEEERRSEVSRGLRREAIPLVS